MDGTFASNTGLTRDDFDPGARGQAILPTVVRMNHDRRWTPNEVALYEEEEEQDRLRQQPRQQRGAVIGVASDRSEELRRAESREKRRMAQEAMQIADLTDDVAVLVHQADEQFETLDTNLADNIEYAMQGAEAVGTHAKGTVMGSETLGYGTKVATAGATGTAIGGAAGAIGGLLLPIPGGAPVGGAVGAGLGAIFVTTLTKAQEDAVRATIDRQLQAARDVVRGETGDEGPLADADQVKWKYAELTGLVWSREMTPRQLMADLAGLSARNRHKPVKIKWNRVQRSSCASFANTDEAAAWIRQALQIGTAGAPPATTAYPVGQRDAAVARATRRVAAESTGGMNTCLSLSGMPTELATTWWPLRLQLSRRARRRTVRSIKPCGRMPSWPPQLMLMQLARSDGSKVDLVSGSKIQAWRLHVPTQQPHERSHVGLGERK